MKTNGNNEGEEAHDDLATLAHLDEPNILRALSMRFEEDRIYTSVGPILVAVNPWKRLPHLYLDSALAEHMRNDGDAQPQPRLGVGAPWPVPAQARDA